MDSIVTTKSLRAFVTRAEFASSLLAPPTAYDLAPRYVLDSYRRAAPQVAKALATLQSPAYDRISRRDLAKDMRVALELTAPIALGGVRAFFIGAALVHCAANPVTLILGGPALLLTGKKLLADLRRAFVVDPEIRRWVQLAHEAAVQNDFVAADQHFKAALAMDVNPSNPRNADIYLHQGLLYIQHQRPRQALIALTKASVLIGENEVVAQPREGAGKLKLSKRGMAELLALACLDSFAKDDAGIEEWNEIAKDFASSASLRFEKFAQAKDAGHLFGLFGVDPTSAEANRALVAKVRFLQAKIESRKNLRLAQSRDRMLAAVNEGRKLLQQDATLSLEERATALLEQAQFYFSATVRGGKVQLEMLEFALTFADEAAAAFAAEQPDRAILTRAEALSFALSTIPRAVEQGTEGVGAMTRAVAERLEGLLGEVEEASRLDGAPEYLLWAYEQLYRLWGDPEDKRRALEGALRVADRARDPVAAFHAALRLTFLGQEQTGKERVLAATRAMAADADAVVASFGARYAAELSEGEAATELFARAAERFSSAGAAARSVRQIHPFYLQGRAVAHDWRETAVILHTLGAHCFLRAGRPRDAIRALEAAEVTALQADSKALQSVLEAMRLVARCLVGDLDAAAELREWLASPDPEHRQLSVWARKLAETLGVPLDGQDQAEPARSAGPEATQPESALEGLLRRRADLQALVRGAAELVREGGPDELVSLLDDQARKLAEGRFHLAIVGEFSTGKSTFINAVLGSCVLPSSARPTTAAINRIIWGEAASATVFLKDAPAATIPVGELAEYITERKNPGNKKCVTSVEIRYPLELLRDGITLLDTPGIASLFQAHTDITYQIIPSCDAVLLLTSATMPYSASEKEFLTTLKEQLAGKVFLVINKIDQLSQVEATRVIEFVTENARKELADIRIYPVSSYWALAGRLIGSAQADAATYTEDQITGGITSVESLLQGSRFRDFETQLFRFLVENKGTLLLESVAHGVRQVLGEVQRVTDAELRAQSLSLAEVREKAKQLLVQAERSREAVEAALKDCAAAFDGAQTKFSERLRLELPAVERSVQARIEGCPPADLDSLDLGKAVNEEFQRWSSAAAADLARNTRLAIEQAVAGLNAITQELSASYDRSFELDFVDALPALSMEDLHLGASDGGMARSALQGGVIGVAIALLGPIGILAGLVGSAYIDSKLNELRAKKLKDRYRAEAHDAMRAGTCQLLELATVRFRRVRDSSLERLRCQAEAVLRRFEKNAKALVAQREQAEDAAAERGVTLKRRRQVLAKLITESRSFSRGHGRA